ncbi:MAG: arsenate reductase (glutaredoxin) [Methylococcales bacterium]|nr:arsenate reductase (glutaredoxin) [Methylococcales bacterium]
MTVRIYHNPRCSKSRQTLALLRERGIEPDIIEYLKHPPGTDTLSHLLTLLNLEPRALMRTQETEYKANNLDNPKLSREQLVQALHDHPKLIERPIVVTEQRAVIGRPPENILTLLE